MGFLSLQIFFPVLCGLLLMFLPKLDGQRLWQAAVAVAAVAFSMSVVLWTQFNFVIPSVYQWEERLLWIGKYGIYYHVGVDGLGLAMVTLSSFLVLVTLWLSRQSIKKRIKEFIFFILLLETCLIGVFCAIDMFQFYLFWEMSIVPVFFLIGVFGGEKRIYAAKKFAAYMVLGSLFMLVGFISVYVLYKQGQGYATTSFNDLVSYYIPQDQQVWLLGLFLIGFLITIPMFPFYTWFNLALVEAPIVVGVLLAGVFIKLGAYSIVRFAVPLFPSAVAQVAPVMVMISAATTVYGAVLAYKQTDLKAVLAYSSLASMGLITMGIFSLHELAVTGAMFHMVAHGLFMSALLLLVGCLEHKSGTRRIDGFAGLAKTMPQYSLMFFVALMASIGLPGLCGFVGEFLVIMGVYQSGITSNGLIVCLLAGGGIVLGAVYALRLFGIVFLGPEEGHRLFDKDCCVKHRIVIAVLVVCIVYLGIQPSGMLNVVKYELPAQTQKAVKFDWVQN